MRQFGGAPRDVHVTRAFDKFAQHLEPLVHVPEGMLRQDALPLVRRPFELARKGVRGNRGLFRFQPVVKDPANPAALRLPRSFKFFDRSKTH